MPTCVENPAPTRGRGRAVVIADALLGAGLLLFLAASALPDSPATAALAARGAGVLTVTWSLVLALVLARWILALRADGLARIASGFGVVPFSAVAAGAAAFLMAYVNVPGVDLSWALLLVEASCAAAFLLSWSARAWRIGKGARFGLLALYVGISVLLPITFQRTDRWKGLLEAGEEPAAAVVADKQGKGSDVTFQRVNVGDDWRNAAVIMAGGFFYEELNTTGDEVLKFSVARSGEASGSLVVTAVAGDTKKEAWRSDVASISSEAWNDVSVPVGLSGRLRIAFEFDARQPGRVFVANNRIESSVKSAPPAGGQARASGRNVILVVEDALRADRLGVYGSTLDLSPEIDRLAGDAVVFDRCIAAAPWTRPSIATIFTSVYPSVHGVETFDGVLSPSFDTVAEVFQRAGYRTAAVQANATLEAERGFAQGFDEYKLFRLLTPTQIDPGVNPRADVVTATALDWLSQRGSAPFFLYVHYMDTHSPYSPPREFSVGAESPEDYYNGAVRFFSFELSKVFAALKSAGLLDTTTVVVTADHGEQFEEHGETQHGNSVHIEEVHVPLIVWSPGARTGSRVSALVSTVDIPVTLIELAGLEAGAAVQGVSFAPALGGGQLGERDVYSELLTYKVAGHRYVGVTSGRWRFICDTIWQSHEAGGSLVGQLFDSGRDPGERADVSAENPEVARDMSGKTVRFAVDEAALGAKLLPNRAKAPLSPEEIEKLSALGYISPSDDGK